MTEDETMRKYAEAHGCPAYESAGVFETCGQRYANDNSLGVRPLPCMRANGKTFEMTTLREWLAKIHEEITEMEEKAFGICGLDDYPQKETLYGTQIETEFALECADVATVLASMQEAFGIDAEARDEAQRRVNNKNRERGRL